MTLEEQFKQAEGDVQKLKSRPDNNTLLRLYSYHKQAMKGDAPDEGPTNIFDFVGKAKYEAWKNAKGLSTEQAMQEYVNLVNELLKR
jgi:diazepam-binding inhibitor (GABA receptor modulator, acyl-CoA-binding protein)